MPYFAYCTLLDEAEMRRFVSTATAGATGTIDGYRVVFGTHGPGLETGGCNLEADPGHVIHGLLYDLSDDEFAQLDTISGVDRGLYQRIAVDVTTSDGQMPAETYVIPQSGGRFAPTTAYTQPIITGARALGLPLDYVAELEAAIAGARE
jgi:gamma-glutamylcyclotransferase (GGCT)/AIG2-like uncharacterized protein YtfP